MNKKSKASSKTLVLPEHVYKKIRAKIFQLDIYPGQRINIDALVKELGVSHTPIRESLARLEAEGLTIQIPLKGYFATNLLTVGEFRDLFSFRLILEPWAASEAAKNISEAQIKSLKVEIAKGKNAWNLNGMRRIEAFTSHDARFHSLIAESAGNDNLKNALERAHCHLHLLRLYVATRNINFKNSTDSGFVTDLFKHYYDDNQKNIAFVEHKKIADAIINGNHTLAKASMASHINNSLKRFTRNF